MKNSIQKEAPCSLFYQNAKEKFVSIFNVYRHLVGLGDTCACNETAKALKLPLENRHYPQSGLFQGMVGSHRKLENWSWREVQNGSTEKKLILGLQACDHQADYGKEWNERGSGKGAVFAIDQFS